MRTLLFIFLFLLGFHAQTSSPLAYGQSTTIRLPQERMDVREALRLLRVATEHMEVGDYDRACSIYDHLLHQFRTWWIPMAGRTRCGLMRSEDIEKMARFAEFVRAYEAPSHVVQRLNAAVAAERERLQRIRDAQGTTPPNAKGLPAPLVVTPTRAEPAKPLPPPNADRFMDAWKEGKYSVVLKEAHRFEHANKLSSGVLRIATEAALLLQKSEAVDHFMPLLLTRTRNMPLLVRYLRDLKRRKAMESYRKWLDIWERWNRSQD